MALFGDPEAPDFESVFNLLAGAGFDLVFPYFGIHEDVDGNATTAHFEHFLPPELLPDGHPISDDLGTVGDFAGLARGAAAPARVVSVLQGFGLEDLTNQPGPRPTRTETRFMAYNAIVNGASVVFWWGQSAMDIGTDSVLWNAILDTASELQGLSGVFAGDRFDPLVTGPEVDAAGWRINGVTWLVLTNRRMAATSARVTVTPPAIGRYWTIHDVLGDRVVAAGVSPCSPISVALPPYGVAILVIVTC